MINKTSLRCGTVLLLFCAVLTAFLLPVTASSGQGVDLSRPASDHGVTLLPADVVEYILGSPVTDAERNYLNAHGNLTIKYDVGITTAYVVTEYHSGTLTVIAQEYSYTATDGTLVKWIPVSATVADSTVALTETDGGYRGELYGVAEDDGTAATVDYRLDVTLSADAVNTLLNLVLNDAPTVLAELEAAESEYARLKAEYDADLIEYGDYLLATAKHEADLAAYTEYLSLKKIYDDARAEYEAYVTALAEYEAALRAEEEYNSAMLEYNTALAAYNAYVSALADYEAKLADYNQYLSDIQRVADQLAALDAFWVPMTDGRTAAGAINGSLVTEVLEGNRDLFEGNTFKVDACLIDDAGAATRELRSLMAEYHAKATEAEKYQYYINNHAAFRDNTVLLLQSLDELYNYDKVRGGINLKDTTYPRKYEILVAQLAIIANALNDGPVQSYWAAYHTTKCNSSCTLSSHAKNRYVINLDTKIHKYTVSEMLEGKDYLTDHENAEPLESGIPIAVDEPTKPTEVQKPVKPTAPTVPAKPTKVDDPGVPPTPVTDPGKAPDEVAKPTAPDPYVPAPEKLAIVEMYRRGELAEREELTADPTFTACTSVTKRVFNVDTVTVFFYDLGGELLYRTEVEAGTRADFVGAVPAKAEDASATYAFSHWIDAEGTPVSLYSIEHDLALYPAFTPTVKNYDVTFTVDGHKTVISTPYGSVPEFPEVPKRPDDNYREYTFADWSPSLTEVTGNCEYVATFSSEYILPLSSGGAEITVGETDIIAKCNDPFTYRFDLSGLVERATLGGSARGIILDTRVFDISISYATLLKMREAGETELTLNRTVSGQYTYYCSATIGSGEYRINAVLPCSLAEGRQLRLYYLGSDEEKNAVPYSYADGSVSFGMTTGVKYTLAEEYELHLVENDLVGITVTTGTVARGKRIAVKLDVSVGITLERIYLVYPDGSEVEVSADGFDMPAADVTLCATASPTEYRIAFVSADKTIVVYKLHYGDTVTPPPDPKRPNDSVNRYYFVGWSELIRPVTEDKTYYALYESVPIPKAEEPDGLQISDSILGLIVAGGTFVLMMCVAVIPTAVLAIIFVRRERRKYPPKPKKNTPDNDTADA